MAILCETCGINEEGKVTHRRGGGGVVSVWFSLFIFLQIKWPQERWTVTPQSDPSSPIAHSDPNAALKASGTVEYKDTVEEVCRGSLCRSN